MARKVMKVEGMTDETVLKTINEANTAIGKAYMLIETVEDAFSERDLKSVKLHLDKARAVTEKRSSIVGKKVASGENAEERKRTEKAMREALKDPEKAAALKALLNL